MKNPYVFTGVMIALLVAGWFVGKNWNTWFSEKDQDTKPEGTPCTTLDGKEGTIIAGTCVANAIRPNDVGTSAQRVNPNLNNSERVWTVNDRNIKAPEGMICLRVDGNGNCIAWTDADNMTAKASKINCWSCDNKNPNTPCQGYCKRTSLGDCGDCGINK